MSPPPLPPDPYAEYPDWPPPRDGRHRHAAIAVWVSSSLLLLCSLCCVGIFTAVGFVSMDQLRQADEAGQIPAETWDEIGKAQSYMPVIAAATAVFTVLPAVVMIVLGFGVNRGKRGATVTAMVLSIAALVVIGLLFLLSLLGSVSQGGVDICGLLPMLVLGGCLVWCIVALKGALSGSRYHDGGDYPMPGGGPGHATRGARDDDPWENSL